MTKLADWEIEMMAPQFGGPLAEYLANQVPVEAKRLNREYGRIPVEDFEQAIWLRALERRDALARFHDQDKRWSIDRDLREAGVKLLKEDQRYTRAVKASEEGYSIEDEQFYSTGLLAKILPALVGTASEFEDFDVAEAMQRASSGTDAAGIHIHSSDPHSGAESYQAMLIDISIAYKRLPAGQRRLLRAYYRANQEDTSDGRWERQRLAGSMGLTEEALRQRAHRALSALQAQLGGPSPWRR